MTKNQVKLFWDSADFSKNNGSEVCAVYESLESAVAQARFDLSRGRRPKRVEDKQGKILWRAEDEDKSGMKATDEPAQTL